MLTPAQADRLEVLLVSPRNPLNIGAAARAMANFGFRHLTIVAPFAHNWMEAKSAVGAPDLLREARVCDTLAEAVAKCTLVLGTGSLDRRRPEQTILTLPEAARQIRQALAPATMQDSTKGTSFSPHMDAQVAVRALEGAGKFASDCFVTGHDFSRADKANQITGSLAPEGDHSTKQPRVALLFGSEKHGLTTSDLSWCHAITVIDTADAQPSMNLGQAVAVCLYEISRLPNLGSTGATPDLAEPNSLALPTDQPTSEQLDRLAELIEETMDSVNYATRGMRSANGEALRVLLRRLMPQDADLRRIMGLFRRILWQLRKNP